MPPTTVIYEVYDGGSISGDTFYVWDLTPSSLPISGSTTASRPYDFFGSPNSVPGVSTPTPASLGYPTQGWTTANYDDGVSTKVTIRYFLRKFTVKMEWTDGSVTVPLVGRSIQSTGPHWSLLGNMGASPFPLSGGDDIWFGDGLYRPYGLTDSNGIYTYYGLLGVGIGVPDPSNPLITVWTLLNPSTAASGQHYQDIAADGNFAEYLSQNIASQWTGPLTSDPENTPGWGINYGTAWNASTGMLTSPNPSLFTFQYHQGITSLTIEAGDGSNIPADLTLTPYPKRIGPSYTGTTGTMINMIPNGSLLSNLRLQAGDPDPEVPLTALPILDLGYYNASSDADTGVELIAPLWATSKIGGAANYHTQWTGQSGDDLTGISVIGTQILSGFTVPTTITKDMFRGGEVATLPYVVTWKEQPGGKNRSGIGFVWIHEDRYDTIGLFYLPQSAKGDLDYALDPRREPFLTIGATESADQVTTPDMETTFKESKILTEGVGCPSRAITPDHSHYLAGIDDNAHVKIWISTNDGDTFAAGTVIDSSTTWAGCCLRTDAADSIHLWMIDNEGGVWKRISTDGGGTFSTLAAVSTIPALPGNRADFRFDGSAWIAAVPVSGGSIELYSSPTGEDDWVHEVQVVSAGLDPVLLQLGLVRDWLVVFEDPKQISSRRLSDVGGSWAVGASILVAPILAQPAAYWDPQHGWCAYLIPAGTVQFSQTHDDGDHWVLFAPENDVTLNYMVIENRLRDTTRTIYGGTGDGVIHGSYSGSLLSAGTGLNVDVANFEAVVGAVVIVTGLVIPVPASTTSYLWLNEDGTATVTATNVNPGNSTDPAIPLGSVVTSGSAVTSTTDTTQFVTAPQSALTFTAPIVDTAGVVSMAAATSSTSGYLTSTDWNTFNGKLSSESDPLSLHTAGGTMTGDISISGTVDIGHNLNPVNVVTTSYLNAEVNVSSPLIVLETAGATLSCGTVSPNGVVTQDVGSLYINTTGPELWFKTSGSGTSSGWTQITIP